MSDDPIDKLHKVDSELVIGLVGAVGTDLGRVADLLENQLVRTGYKVDRVKISTDAIPHFGAVEYDGHDEFDRITKLMDAGNLAREKGEDESVLGLGAASTMAAKRSDGEEG